MDIIDKIKYLTNQKGWTIYQLSNEADIGQSTLTNMFTRGTLPSITTLTKLCDAFGITLSQFFDESDTNGNISYREKELINLYRNLPVEKQDLLIKILKK